MRVHSQTSAGATCRLLYGCIAIKKYLAPLAAEVFAYHELTTCSLRVWCTHVQMHYPVSYGMKLVSLCNMIGAKCPPPIPGITHPRQPFGHRSLSGVQFDCATDHRVACSSHLRHMCDHVIMKLEPWLRESVGSSPYPKGYLNAKRRLMQWIDNGYIVV